MFEQLFEESPMIQKKLEQAREQYYGEGIAHGKVEMLQRTLVDFVEVKFPDLTDFAQEQAKLLSNPDVLEALIHKLFAASDATMAQRLLESMPEQPV